MKQKRKFFLLTDLIWKRKNDLQTVTGVASPVVCVCSIPDKIYCDIYEPYITGDVCTLLLRSLVPVEIRSHN